jgi:hypothetical protein
MAIGVPRYTRATPGSQQITLLDSQVIGAALYQNSFDDAGMSREGTREAAESVLRELPSVIGAFVREDVNGHPREIHLLVRSGPSPRHLAYDVRDLLEERLGIPIDQRVVSIAQLAPGRKPGPMLASRAGMVDQPGERATAAPEPAAPAPAETTDRRVLFGGISRESMENRVRIRVALNYAGRSFNGEVLGLDTPAARMRSAAAATLQAVDMTCVGRARFEVEHVTVVHAFEREYVLVTVLVSSPFLGRRPIPLVGAHPVEVDDESAAAMAALKAVNRTLSLALHLVDSQAPRSMPRSRRG